jgi:hypothetical protein
MRLHFAPPYTDLYHTDYPDVKAFYKVSIKEPE